MAAITTNIPPFHDLEYASSYTPLPSHLPSDSSRPAYHRKAIKVLVGIFLSLLFLVSLIAVILYQGPKLQQQVNVIQENSPFTSVSPANLTPASRGVSQGVSEKMVRDVSGGTGPYPWTNDMLSWQRTSFHFQPEENWMNDPNGPLFYKGWYHLFYQYNPDSAIWGNITWGHAVSKDLIHWLYLPIAMEPDQWYDINGVWTGSATILPNGEIVMLYTGDTDKFVQVQNLAYPADPDDSLLRNWVKYPGNPVLVPPPGIGPTDFRDPTTAWIAPDGGWMITIGSKVNKTGVALVYKTTNFTSFQLLDGYLHAVPGTGMWECVDFFPISTSHENGLDTSVNGLGVKHFLKASLDGNKRDYYALGTYDPIKNRWTPDNPRLDVGFGLRLDYGNYYASKTFYDQSKQRRILWGWIGETDTESADIKKGWASIQTIPRTVVFDKKTRTNILQWPVDEVESLRSNSTEFKNVGLEPGSVVPLDIGPATQLDIVATFEVNEESFVRRAEANADYQSTSNEGVSSRGIFGPFGLLVLADDTFSEQTAVYFYLAKDGDGKIDTHFCADQSRSSMASDVGKVVYGSRVPVLDNEKLTMRLLVDHSIVESFAQGGRSVITSRIYPTKAIYGAARVFLFNNATRLNVSASVKIWHMNSAYIYPFPADSTPI